MQNVNYGGANFYTLSKPVAVRIDTSIPVAGLAPISVQKDEIRPVVIITGRGKSAGRVPNLVRLLPDVVEEIKSLVDGPLYLTIELLLVAGFGMIGRSPMMTGSCCVGWCQLHDRFAATRAYKT